MTVICIRPGIRSVEILPLLRGRIQVKVIGGRWRKLGSLRHCLAYTGHFVLGGFENVDFRRAMTFVVRWPYDEST